MKALATVTLELLRRDPGSPLPLSRVTDYQALCGNHPAQSLRLPFEHREFMRRIQALRYDVNASTRQDRAAALERTAEQLAEVFGHVPGLLADIAGVERHEQGSDMRNEGVIHLRLVLSAKETAYLPYELAFGPNGFPSPGRFVSLQTVAPICITRETRRAAGSDVTWPDEPSVLFAYASPHGISPVPAAAHLAELRKAVDPWVWPMDAGTSDEEQVRRRLTVLPQATLGAIRRACAKSRYTHVHILAHGDRLPEGGGFGLALCADKSGTKRVVDGGRLASVLCTHHTPEVGAFLSSPTVVTLASCDGGNIGELLASGASVAHDLHQEGVPLVVASQFPLTKAGSVVMVRSLYSRILWAEDPRVVLHDVRHQLYQHASNNHDWASLVAYASLPPDLDGQLLRARSRLARLAMGVAMTRAEAQWKNGGESSPHPKGVAALGRKDDEAPGKLDRTLSMLDRAIARLPERQRAESSRVIGDVSAAAEELGIRGSAEKRRAYLIREQANDHLRSLVGSLQRAKTADGTPTTDGVEREKVEADLRRYQRERGRMVTALSQAMVAYRAAFEADMSTHWAGIQYLSLETVMGRAHEIPDAHWTIAHAIAAHEADAGASDAHRAWAHASLMEFELLWLAVKPKKAKGAPKRIKRSLDAFVKATSPGSYEVKSTLRQFERYASWYCGSRTKDLEDQLARLLDQFAPGHGRRLQTWGLLHLPSGGEDGVLELASEIVDGLTHHQQSGRRSLDD